MDNKTKNRFLEIQILLLFIVNIAILFTMYTNIQKAASLGKYFQDIYPAYFLYGYGISYLILLVLSILLIRRDTLGSLSKIANIKRIEIINVVLVIINLVLSLAAIIFYLLINSNVISWHAYYIELTLLSVLTLVSVIGFVLIIVNIILNHQLKHSYS